MRTLITILILLLVAVVAPHAPHANPSAAQSVFATAYNTSTNGLVGWWKLESDSGGVAVDQMGNNDGTWEGGASSTDAAGFVGNGGDFDGTNDYVDLNFDPSAEIGAGDFSVSVWINGDVFESFDRIMQMGINHYKEESIQLIPYDDGTNIVAGFYANDGSDHTVYSDKILDNNQWYHLALIRNGQNIKVFVNGQEEIDDTNSQNDVESFDRVYLAAQTSLPASFNGKIDEVRIYDRALSAHEIRRLYLQGHSQSDEVNE